MTDALRKALAALETGRDCAVECATKLHTELAGYKQHKHDAADADVAQIDAAITAVRSAIAAPPGWAQVPVEPTPEMQWAGVTGLDSASHSDIDPTLEEVAACYRAMLAAAPDAPTTQSHPQR